jgi:hypothetical protein
VASPSPRWEPVWRRQSAERIIGFCCEQTILVTLKRREEAKREAHWDRLQRWRALQDAITWAESLPSVRRNTRETCLRLQAAKLAALR